MKNYLKTSVAIAAAIVMSGTLAANAQRITENSGVRHAEGGEPVEGPKPIAGTKAFESPIPFFRDLGPWDPNYKAPRTLDGKADLQGVWSTASLTTMTRSNRGAAMIVDTLVIPPEKIAEVTNAASYTQSFAASQKRTDPTSGVFTDRNPDAGYNAFWIDPGSEYAKVNGEWRSSWIVEPATGQIPYNRGGQTALGARTSNAGRVDNTGPEIRTLGDRCLVSFANQGGPPLNNAMYNNNIEIVQTPDHIMLNIEMNHDARIIRIRKDGEKAAALPKDIRQWFGDSVGWWEGDTLVVETHNVHPLQARGRIPLSPDGKVIERFSRVSDKEIFYQFEVHDPVNYTQVWKGEMPMRKSNEHVYEYACHEGNYALPGILRGMTMGLDTAIDAEGE
jgi:hypothetical protein